MLGANERTDEKTGKGRIVSLEQSQDTERRYRKRTENSRYQYNSKKNLSTEMDRALVKNVWMSNPGSASVEVIAGTFGRNIVLWHFVLRDLKSVLFPYNENSNSTSLWDTNLVLADITKIVNCIELKINYSFISLNTHGIEYFQIKIIDLS